MIKNRPAILALLTALNFLSYIDRLVLPAVLASVEKELDLSKTAVGLGATAFLIGYFVATPLAAASFFMPARPGSLRWPSSPRSGCSCRSRRSLPSGCA